MEIINLNFFKDLYPKGQKTSSICYFVAGDSLVVLNQLRI